MKGGLCLHSCRRGIPVWNNLSGLPGGSALCWVAGQVPGGRGVSPDPSEPRAERPVREGKGGPSGQTWR